MGGFKAAVGVQGRGWRSSSHAEGYLGVLGKGDTTLHGSGVWGMQQEGEKPPRTEHPQGMCTWAGPCCAIVPRAMQHPQTNLVAPKSRQGWRAVGSVGRWGGPGPPGQRLPGQVRGFGLGFWSAKGLPCPFDSHTGPSHPSGLSWSFHQNKSFPWRFLLS